MSTDLSRDYMGQRKIQSWPDGSIPVRAIKRGMLVVQYVPPTGTNYSITDTSFVEVDASNLAGRMTCTGRPIRIDLTATVAKGTTTIALSVTIDGVEVTNTSNGMAIVFDTATATPVASWHYLMRPQPGERRFAVVAKVNAGTGTIFGDGGNRISMSVEEK